MESSPDANFVITGGTLGYHNENIDITSEKKLPQWQFLFFIGDSPVLQKPSIYILWQIVQETVDPYQNLTSLCAEHWTSYG